MNNQKGFSLVEIMIVLVILGSLIALISRNATDSLDKAKYSEGKMQISQIKDAITMYYSDCGFFPDQLSSLLEQDNKCDNWGPRAYLEEKAMLDPWKHEFGYELLETGYRIVFFGKDGREGGSDYSKDFEEEVD